MREITKEDIELFQEAKSVLQYSYAPFSHFNVGAALMTKDGKIYTGVNIENSSFGATICAERTAVVKAVSEGETKFKKIAVACSDGTAWPCGICRQVLYEFEPNIEIIAGDSVESLTSFTLTELLVNGFRLDS